MTVEPILLRQGIPILLSPGIAVDVSGMIGRPYMISIGSEKVGPGYIRDAQIADHDGQSILQLEIEVGADISVEGYERIRSIVGQ